ncbi:MAG: glycosyltransferase family 4 protein [Candidatus Omnitrophica bacterium]|nr:glycosyltransferase family 4 protein [Candidatus Omnitrophota bacterium]
MTPWRYDAVVVIHRVLIDSQPKPGGLDRVLDLLAGQGWRLGIVEHPLDACGPSSLRYRDGGAERPVLQGLAWCRWPLLRWTLEPAWTVWAVRRAFAPSPRAVALCADPLNAVAGWGLQRLGVVQAFAFHIADFSTRRFGQPWLDALYLRLFRFVARRARVVTAVSQRIMEYLQAIPGLDARRVLRFPNSPVTGEMTVQPIGERQPASIVMMAGSLSPWVGVEPVLESLRLARQTIPQLTLRIIGGFLTPEEAERLARQIQAKRLDDAVRATGFLPQPRALALAASSWIGVAWYAEDSAWSHYCDSMKIWEYAACGLPVVANRVSGTAEELQQAGGGVVADTPAAMAEALVALCRNPERYAQMAGRARAWAEAHDKRRLVDALITHLRASAQLVPVASVRYTVHP